MHKFLVVAAVAVVVAASLVAARAPKWHEIEGYTFDQFLSDFNKPLAKGTEEYKMRKHIFLTKVQAMKKHNADSTQTYKRGINQFTDMTAAEWKKFNAFKKSPHRPAPASIHSAPANWVPPVAVDLRTRMDPQIITPVKHQGSCGCCWAVSGTESMEAYHALQTGLLSTLSFAQMNACTPAPGAYGCDGGDYAMGWLAAQGYPLNEEWPYGFPNFFFPTSGTEPTAKCMNMTKQFPNKHPYNWFAQLTQVGIASAGYVSVLPNNATALMSALAEVGPQSISVAAGNWQDYETGIFKNTGANGQNHEWGIDHAVQCVGYGYDKDLALPYWIVKNSWSTNWGRAGYIYLYRTPVGTPEPCSPVEFGPVCGTSGILSDPQRPITKNLKSIPF